METLNAIDKLRVPEDRDAKLDGLNSHQSTTGALPAVRPHAAIQAGKGSLLLGSKKIIFEEGQRARNVYQVISGAVILSRKIPDGTRQVIRIVGADDFFGHEEGSTRCSRAETVCGTEVRSMTRYAAERNPRIQKVLALQIRKQHQELLDHAVIMFRNSAAERVAHMILSLPLAPSPVPVVPGERARRDRVALSQSEIASYLGLRSETVCRVLGEFKRSGLISTRWKGRLSIDDPEALAERVRSRSGAIS